MVAEAAPRLLNTMPTISPTGYTGLHLVPPLSNDDEWDCFDDGDVAPPTAQEVIVPSWYEPHMITDNIITYHDYQQQAIAEVLNAFLIEKLKAVRLIMPTGCGKTVVFNGISKRLSAMDYRVLVLVHRNDLLRQADEKMQRVGVVPLIEQGNTRARPHFFGERRVVVASVQSLHKKRLKEWPRDSFDFIISDECHHVRQDQKNWWWMVSKWFNAQHLGVTATPGVTKSIKGKKRYINIPGWQRDIEPLQMMEAIEKGYLAPLVFKQVKTDIDLRSVARVFGEDSDFKQNELDAVIYRNTNRLATAIKENIGNRPTIIFTPLVASAEALAAALNDIGVKSASVSADTSDREGLYKSHERGDFQCLVNCMVCTEGFDAPYIECVVLARPTQSVNIYRQIVGRGTRTSPATGKTNCLIVDFAFITGSLPLVGGAEMLREKLKDENEEDVEAILAAADDILKEGNDRNLLEVLDEARLTVEEMKEKERIKAEIAERDRQRREALRLKNQEERFRYEVTTLDPFATNLLGIPQHKMDRFSTGAPATDGQKNFITKLSKGKINVETLTKSAASAIIGQLKQDMDAGRASFPQREVLTRRLGEHNLTPEQARGMTFQEASAYISEHKTW